MTELIPLHWLVIAVGVFGLLVGSFLNIVAWRVPRGESLLPVSRCSLCRELMSMRYPFVELGTGAAFALVAWWWSSSVSDYGQTGAEAAAWWLALGGYLGFAAAGIVLTLIDLHHQRLPDIIVLPGLVVVLSLFSASALLWGEWSRLGSTLGAAIALFVLYFVIALVYPRGIGGGDVKLAPLVGATLGFVGWGAVVVGTFAGFLLGAAFGLVLIALRRATRKSGIPFGPFMLAGSWVGIVWGQALMSAYLALFGLG